MNKIALIFVAMASAAAAQFHGPAQPLQPVPQHLRQPQQPQLRTIEDNKLDIAAHPLSRLAEQPLIEPASANEISDSKVEEEPGFVDSVFGEGTQSRVVASVNSWVAEKAKTNPGCIERFVCETHRTGEGMKGFPYLVMQIANAAISFMVADMFDQSIDIQEITRAARYGRTMGTCDTMKCDFADGQLRTIGDYLGSFEDFFSSIVNSVSNSISLG